MRVIWTERAGKSLAAAVVDYQLNGAEFKAAIETRLKVEMWRNPLPYFDIEFPDKEIYTFTLSLEANRQLGFVLEIKHTGEMLIISMKQF